MKTRYATSLFGLLALSLALRAGAATVSLQPSAGVVAHGSTFTVDLLLDAADVGGAPILGSVVIDFDPALIGYNGFTLTNGLSYQAGETPTVGSANGHQTVTLGFLGAPATGTIGTFSLTAPGAPQSVAAIGLDDADLFSSFFKTTPTNQPFFPTFSGTSIQISAVPLPATAWLFATCLGAALTRLRRPAS